jgi:rhodanese-related sulfurtransferase
MIFGRPSLEPEALKAQLEGDEPPVLLDVREAEEWAFCHLEGAMWIPLAELERRAGEIPAGRPVVCMCHHGGRSAAAQRFLEKSGFPRVYNLTGGIDGWSRRVDPGVPRY